MDAIRVEGGYRLNGTVRVEGAKNSALKLMAATIMAPGVFHLGNVPDISDVKVMAQVLETLGASVLFDGNNVTIDTTSADRWVTPYELVNKMRASISILGPLITRFGRAVVSMPGGCNIGARGIDQHLAGLEKLGCRISNAHGDIVADASEGLTGTTVKLNFASVGATENVMMGAVKARGVTVIDNAAREPEIVDLASMLNAMGADIRDAGSSVITIRGVSELHACDHVTVGDRIEAGTFAVAGAMMGTELTVRGFDPFNLDFPLKTLEQMGVSIERLDDGVVVRPAARLVPANIATLPYPGFPTDMQAQFMALATMVNGTTHITENIFENRFMLAAELARMGADIAIEGRYAKVNGPVPLMGARVAAPDLRGGAALVLAGLVAEGETFITNTHHIKRGYQGFVEKLASLGAHVAHIEVPGQD